MYALCVCMFLLYVYWTFSALWKSLEIWRTLGKEEIWLNLWKYLLGSRELRDLPSSIQEGLGTTLNRTQSPWTDTLCLGLVMWCYQSALVLRDLWTMPGGAWWAYAVSGMELEYLCMEGFCYSVLSSLPGLYLGFFGEVKLKGYSLQCMEDHMGCQRSILGQLHVDKSPTNCIVTLALT